MQRSFRTAFFGIAAALFLALPLSAQTPPAPLDTLGDLESNTAIATAWLFGNDVDNYMNVRGYMDTQFEKWFAFISGDGTPKVTVGYGHKLQDLYLGVWYQGNLLRFGDGSETSTIVPTYDDTTKALTQTIKTKSYSTTDSWIESANQVEFFVGVAGQGIKLGFYEAMSQNKLPGARDFTVTDTQNGLVAYANEVDEYSRLQGYVRPYLSWGSVFELAGGVLSPYAKFTLNCFQDTQIDNTKSYDVFLGKKSETVTTNRYAGQQAGYVEPIFSFGADFALPQVRRAELSFALDYDLSFRAYDNDYAASGVSGNAKGPVYWNEGAGPLPVNTTSNYIDRKETVTNANLRFEDTTYSSHLITPSFTVTGKFYRDLKMGLYLGFPIGINVESVNAYSDTYAITKTTYHTGDKVNNRVNTTRTHNNDSLTETSNFSLSADLGMGFSCPLIPGRFTINGGINISPFVWNRSTVKVSPNGVTQATYTTVRDGNGETITSTTVINNAAQSANDSVTLEDTWTPLRGQVCGGFVFYFGSHTALDLLASHSLTDDFGLEATSLNLMFTVTF